MREYGTRTADHRDLFADDPVPFGFLLGGMPAEKSDRLLRYAFTIFHVTTLLLTLWIFLWYWDKNVSPSSRKRTGIT